MTLVAFHIRATARLVGIVLFIILSINSLSVGQEAKPNGEEAVEDPNAINMEEVQNLFGDSVKKKTPQELVKYLSEIGIELVESKNFEHAALAFKEAIKIANQLNDTELFIKVRDLSSKAMYSWNLQLKFDELFAKAQSIEDTSEYLEVVETYNSAVDCAVELKDADRKRKAEDALKLFASTHKLPDTEIDKRYAEFIERAKQSKYFLNYPDAYKYFSYSLDLAEMTGDRNKINYCKKEKEESYQLINRRAFDRDYSERLIDIAAELIVPHRIRSW